MEQGADRACLADWKKKEGETLAPWVGGIFKIEFNKEMSPGKQMGVFSLLPSPQSWQQKGH